MTILPPPELERYIQERIDSGAYNSANEVVHDALRLLKERDAIYGMRLELLRKDIQVALEQSDRGEGTEIDFNEFKERARKRLAERQSSANNSNSQ